jgi:autotransporter adhesin
LGSNAFSTGRASVAVGSRAFASQNNAIAIGTSSQAVGLGSISIGGATQSQASNAIAFGTNAIAQQANSVAIGFGAVAAAENSVALGAGARAIAPGTVSIGAPGSERRLTNLAAGIAGTDAVNLNQLDEVRIEARRGVAGVAAMIGGVQPGFPGETAVSFGVGHYKDQTATGIGIRHWIKTKEERTKGIRRFTLEAGASVSEQGEDNVYRIGAGFVF